MPTTVLPASPRRPRRRRPSGPRAPAATRRRARRSRVMDAIYAFYSAHPFWVWLAAGAVLLAVEVMSGSGYLLWPAAAAAVVGLLALGLHPGLPVELGVFAGLTLVSTILARRYLPNPLRP